MLMYRIYTDDASGSGSLENILANGDAFLGVETRGGDHDQEKMGGEECAVKITGNRRWR